MVPSNTKTTSLEFFVSLVFTIFDILDPLWGDRVQPSNQPILESAMKREELKIASPCHENFDDMQGSGAKRFCDSCSKHVTNLSDMTKIDADKFLKESAGSSVCVRYQVNGSGEVVFGRPSPDRVQRQIHGARKMLAAAAMMLIPLLSACESEPADCQRTTPESTLIQSERAILEKLASVGFEVDAILDYINPFDPYEEMVMGEMAMIEPIDEIEPVFAELQAIPDDQVLMPVMGQMAMPEPEPEVEPEHFIEMMGDIAVAPDEVEEVVEIVEEPEVVEKPINEEREFRMGKIAVP